MTDRDLKVRVDVDSRGAEKGLRGTTRAVQQAAQRQRRSKDETRRAVQRAEEESEKATRRTAERGSKAVETAERRKRREIRETAREAARAAQQAQGRDGRGRFLPGAGGGGRGGRGGRGGFGERAMGAAAGMGTAAWNRLQGMQGALGVPSRDQLVQMFIAAEQEFIRTSRQAGLSSDQRAQVQSRVLDVSRRTNVDPSQLLGSLTIAQNRFSDLQFVSDNLETFARTAQATGSSVEDWVGAVGEFRRQLGVTAEDVPNLIGSMVSAAREGSIEAGDVAANFSGLMSSWVALRGEGGRGASGAREFLATAEALGGAGTGPEGTRVLMENLMTALRRGNVQRHIEGRLHDRNIFDRGGRLTIGMDELLGRMSQDEFFSTPAGLQRLGFQDVQQQTAMSHLMNQFQTTGGNEIARLKGVSSEEGLAIVDATMRELMGSTSGRALNQQITAEANFLQNGEGIVRLMTELTGPLTEWQTRMPIASEAISFLGESARNAGVTLATLRLLGVGGAAAGAAGAAGAGAGGAGAGGLLGGGVAAAGSAALAAGAASFLGTIAIANETGLFQTGEFGKSGGRNLGQQWDDLGQEFNAALGVNWFGDAGATEAARARLSLGKEGGRMAALANGASAATLSKDDVREGMRDALRDAGPLDVRLVNTGPTAGTGGPERSASVRERGRG